MEQKILVVEDDPETRDLITVALESRGFDVIVANDGYEGMVVAAARQPAVIIADIQMPKINGIEMIKLLREFEQFRKVPILAVTAYGMEMAMEAIAAGANRAVAKPLDPDVLLAFVSEALKTPERP